MTQPVVCVDFGSTFTKAVLVDVDAGTIVASASHRTTIGTDVLDGFDTCLLELAGQDERAADADVLACSSAGGGLRIAVVGNEELVTAEAGRRVALSSGGKVVLVSAGGLVDEKYAALLVAEPDLILLVGGTDGGNSEVLEADAAFLAARQWPGPVVVAGNIEARPSVAASLTNAGIAHVLADNVVPKIGVLAPDSARAAIREAFLAHVIGGKHLSARGDFTAMVRGATPDVVLTGVELLARGLDAEHPGLGDVVVVDVGGATTDVHSVVEVDPEDAGLSREVVATTPVTRTVEGDLGMRWSAVTTVEAAIEMPMPVDPQLPEAAQRRSGDPGFLPRDEHELLMDNDIAALAAGIAMRRHAGRSRVVLGPDGRVVERSGKDLREVNLLVASGGIFRSRPADDVNAMFAGLVGDLAEGWQVPTRASIVVDRDYVLAAAGLLAADHPEAAYRLVRRLGTTEPAA